MRKTLLYYFSAFISGAVLMAVEMSAGRLLAPYFGNSLYVWTNIIGLIMVALAVGYYCGGRLADKHPKEEVYFTLILLTGFWILSLPFFSTQLFSFLLQGFSTIALAVQWGSFLAILFLFVPPMFLLGMIVPFTIKLILQKVNEVGRVSGKISMISTMGSLLGTFLPAFVLIPFLGTTKTFIFLGLILMYLSAFGLRKWSIFVVATLSLSLFWLVPPVYARSDIIHAEDSAYGYLFITENDEGVRSLHIDNPLGTQSIYDPASPIPDERYYYSYFGVLPAMVEAPKKVLILGHAAGTFTRIFNAYYPDLEITGVELDPAVTRIAQEYMGLADAEVEIVHADARAFLERSEEKYDLILIDTYHVANIPSHLATKEFLDLVALHVNEGGVVALNAAAKEGSLLTVLKNTLAGSFGFTASVPIPGSYNSMLLARKESSFLIYEVPEALESQKEYIEQNLEQLHFASNLEVFLDQKSSRVDLLTEQMTMDLLGDFTLN